MNHRKPAEWPPRATSLPTEGEKPVRSQPPARPDRPPVRGVQCPKCGCVHISSGEHRAVNSVREKLSELWSNRPLDGRADGMTGRERKLAELAALLAEMPEPAIDFVTELVLKVSPCPQCGQPTKRRSSYIHFGIRYEYRVCRCGWRRYRACVNRT